MKVPGESFCFSLVFNSRDLGREVGNFGTDQLSDMDRTQRYVSSMSTTGVQANIACCRWLSWAGLVLYVVNQYLFTSFLQGLTTAWISGRRRMTVQNISWSIPTKECWWTQQDRTHNLLITNETCIPLSHRGRPNYWGRQIWANSVDQDQML